ncbi:MAG: MCE family protein [Alphaproteobacteria bacterium]|nr:MCE family protein [Alphaproteobacteria bacterium]
MRKQPNTRFIGIFVTIGILVFISTILVYLNNRFFANDGKRIVMYFEESINGLNVGSPVVFKGVQIGKVAAIDLITSANDLEFSIPVYITMERRRNIKDGSFSSKETILNRLIEKGLRARLTTQSYLTGLLMIELEMLPNTPIVLKHTKDDDILEIPTVLSPMGELSKGLQNLPIQKSVEEFNNFFAGLNQEIPKILPQINQIVTRINKATSNRSGASADTIANFNRTLTNVSEAARSIRNLADYLEQHPESILKGKKGGN